MNKIIKKIVRYAVIMMLGCFVLSLTGCESWAATMLSESTVNNTSITSFKTFKGTKSFVLKHVKISEGKLSAACSLEKGNMTIYYETDGVKKEWFTLNGGDEIKETVDIPKDGNIKIIFECEEKCENGKLGFKID